jgi:CobQ-like glutamine amidotransferase family enzyme
MAAGSNPSEVTIAVVYPEVLGTYGDGGNGTILTERLRWRGMAASLLDVELGTPMPASCDVYLLGGGEDAPQALAAGEIRREGTLAAAAERGAVVLAVCAGLQVIGSRFLTSDGLRHGAGLVDVETVRGLPRRAVGELVVEPRPELSVPTLTGYENHAGITRLGPGVAPLGHVRSGVGNGTEEHVDGFVVGRVLGTYLHGPVLARNPALADLLLSWVVGTLPEGDERLAQADAAAAELRRERLAAAGIAGAAGTGRRGGGRRRLGLVSPLGRRRRFPWPPTLRR